VDVIPEHSHGLVDQTLLRWEMALRGEKFAGQEITGERCSGTFVCAGSLTQFLDAVLANEKAG
jgi:hypothetical protein